jgi:phospholipid/cholesterol/gamma-HCH transport system substrate-binding protein
MQTRGPSVIQILVALGFALSCFGLLLFLWLAFGGPVPLKPEGYRITVPFKEATQLAVESDVRISGVSVGKVKELELGDDGRAEATLEIDDDFAPLPTDTQATLRSKTLLGETYVELTPGGPNEAPLGAALAAAAGGSDAEADAVETIPEGGSLPEGQVSGQVQLDEILRTFDDPTRESFQLWMQEAAVAFKGRAVDLSAAIATLDPFAEEAQQVLTVLDTQRRAVRELVRNGGEVFDALSERQGQLRSLIENTNSVFATTAARNRELQDLFVVLPTFQREARLTLERLDQFSTEADPLVRQLRPAARELSPTLIAAGDLAPELQGFFEALAPAIRLSRDGLPALRRLLGEDLPPVLGELEPFLNNLTPIIEAARLYRHELTAFLGNATAATNAVGAGVEGPVHYLRTTSPLNPESLAAYPQRLSTNRANPYVKPLGYAKLAGRGIESFETRQCGGGGLQVTLTNLGAGGFSLDPDLFGRLQEFAFGEVTDSGEVPAPPCIQQGPFRSIGGSFRELSRYLHVREDP